MVMIPLSLFHSEYGYGSCLAEHSDSGVCEFKVQQHALPKVTGILFLFVMQRGVRNFESRIILGHGKVCYDVMKSPILIPTM